MYYLYLLLFFFNDTATTEIYTLSLHDALPICKDRVVHLPEHALNGRAHRRLGGGPRVFVVVERIVQIRQADLAQDRKSTRLNSSHSQISYAVFCLKKKKKK